MLFINFKTYQEGTGKNALELIKILEETAESSQIKIIPVVQATDIKEAVGISKLEIWAQNVDPVTYGSHTGSILPESVLEDGVAGTFLNHSERKFEDTSLLQQTINRCSELGLKTLVFASNLEELGVVSSYNPTFVAYEPPEFIGSTTSSVTSAQPDIILKAVETAKTHNLPLIVGAGIHSKEDVRKSLELGATGIAVARDILKAEDPKKELLDLIEGFK